METGRNLIVVTGATGKQGGATARELLAKGHRVRAMTRKPDVHPFVYSSVASAQGRRG